MTVIGVDAGASHVTAGIAPTGTAVTVRRTATPAPSVLDAPGELAVKIATMCGELATECGAVPSHVVAGVAGAGEAAVRTDLAGKIGALMTGVHVRVTTDIETAVAGSFPDGRGIVIAAGTGAFAALRLHNGDIIRAGGWGPVIGDRGSAYDLARSALQHCARLHDEGGSPSHFVRTIIDAAGLSGAAALGRWSTTAGRHRLAVLATTVSELALLGDVVAVALVEDSAEHLRDLALALAKRLPAEVIPVAMTGGLLSRGSPLRSALIRLLATHPFSVTDIEVDGVLGAVRLAAGHAVG